MTVETEDNLNPLMNASGVHCMTVAEMDELARVRLEPYRDNGNAAIERSNPQHSLS